MDFLSKTILGNTLITWLAAIIVGLLIYGFLKFISGLLKKRIKSLADRPQIDASDLVKNLLDATRSFFIIWLSIFTGIRFLHLSDRTMGFINTVTIMVILFQVGSWVVKVIEFWIAHRLAAGGMEESKQKSTFAAVALISKVTVWTLVILLALDNIPGINVTSLIASLGIGGIAIGLAAQNILGDLFSSLTISLDQPFGVGDFINVGDFTGAVEHVGLKSTRIRSLTGEQLIFSNSDLLSSRIRNYKRMERRLVPFTLGVTYQTTYDQLQKIPDMIKNIIEAQPQVTFNRAHFKSYGDFALIFEAIYFVETPDYTLYMDTQQRVNLEIYRQFSEAGIEFAYPTQTIFLDKQQEQQTKQAE